MPLSRVTLPLIAFLSGVMHELDQAKALDERTVTGSSPTASGGPRCAPTPPSAPSIKDL